MSYNNEFIFWEILHSDLFCFLIFTQSSQLHTVYYNALNVCVIKLTDFVIDPSGHTPFTLVQAGLPHTGEGKRGYNVEPINTCNNKAAWVGLFISSQMLIPPWLTHRLKLPPSKDKLDYKSCRSVILFISWSPQGISLFFIFLTCASISQCFSLFADQPISIVH